MTDEQRKLASEHLLELQLKKQEFEVELIRAQQAEMDSARKYNSSIQGDPDATKIAKILPYLVDGFVTLIWGLVTFFLIAKATGLEVGEQIDWTTIMAIYLAISDKFNTILGFHRGSSIGSKRKDKRNSSV